MMAFVSVFLQIEGLLGVYSGTAFDRPDLRVVRSCRRPGGFTGKISAPGMQPEF